MATQSDSYFHFTKGLISAPYEKSPTQEEVHTFRAQTP